MNWTDPLFLILILSGPSLVLSGWIMLKWPAGFKNQIYGYRTKRALQSKEAWEFAQQHSAYEIMKWGLGMMIISLFGLLLEIGETLSIILGLGLATLMTILALIQTENALKKRFG